MSVHETAMSGALQAAGGLMITGGVLAQVSAEPNVGTAGILIGITGLLAAAYPWFTKIVDLIQNSRRIGELEQRIATMKSEADLRIAEAKLAQDRKLLEMKGEYEEKFSELRLRADESDRTRAEAGIRRHKKMDDVSAKIVGLSVGVVENAQAINAILPAVAAAAEAAGAPAPPVAPVSVPGNIP